MMQALAAFLREHRDIVVPLVGALGGAVGGLLALWCARKRAARPAHAAHVPYATYADFKADALNPSVPLEAILERAALGLPARPRPVALTAPAPSQSACRHGIALGVCVECWREAIGTQRFYANSMLYYTCASCGATHSGAHVCMWTGTATTLGSGTWVNNCSAAAPQPITCSDGDIVR